MSEHDSISRTIRRKGMQDIRREIPAYADPIYRPLLNQLKYLYGQFLRNSDTDALEQDINMDFEENSPYQEGVILEMYQRPKNHICRNHQNCKV